MTTQLIKENSADQMEQMLAEVILSGSAKQDDLEGIGERFGFYDAMVTLGPTTPDQIADYTKTSQSTVAAWLGAQLAGDCIDYDVHSGQYSLWSAWPPLR